MAGGTDRFSTDKYIEAQRNLLNGVSKFVYFLAALNATVLGFLFTQTILGNLQGLGSIMVYAWAGFGFCFGVCILYLWEIRYLEINLLSYLLALKNYETRLFRTQEDLGIEQPDGRWSSTATYNYLLETIKDKEFIEYNKSYQAERSKLDSLNKRKITKGLYILIIVFHIITYGGSVVFGGILISSKSNSRLNKNTPPVEQSASEIAPAVEVMKWFLDLVKEKGAPKPSPGTAPVEDQPSPAPESDRVQKQQSNQ